MMTSLMLALIVVDGGPDDGTVWRGWPVHVRADATESAETSGGRSGDGDGGWTTEWTEYTEGMEPRIRG
jgi:hypothetical protein